MIETICFATGNLNKLAEVKKLLAGKIKLVSLPDLGFEDELAEDFLTLEENAKQKAEFIFRKFSIPCFTDDSALEVEALNGGPGVQSARYAGPQKSNSDNISLLLKNLSGKSQRKARFRTVIALVKELSKAHYFEGIVEGEIIKTLKGPQGFGYDPIFVPAGFKKTLAEMSMEEKNSISHRAKAINQLANYLLK